MSDQPEKSHPAAAFIFAIVLAAVVTAVFYVFIGNVPLYLGVMFGAYAIWGVVSLMIFGRGSAPSSH